MNKALKLVLATYGVGLTLVGLSYILFQELDVRKVLGGTLLAVGPFLVLAARDPIRNIQWVRFAIVFALPFVGVSVYLGLFVRDDFLSVLDGILIHGAFATLLLVFYPRQAVRGGGRAAAHDAADVLNSGKPQSATKQ